MHRHLISLETVLSCLLRRSSQRWRFVKVTVVVGAVLLLIACGGGGGGSSGPTPPPEPDNPLSVSTLQINTTHTLGQQQRRADFDVSNNGDSTLSVVASTQNAWIAIEQSAFNLAAGGTQRVDLEFTCTEEETLEGLITVSSGSFSRSIVVVHDCLEPRVEIVVHRHFTPSEGSLGDHIQGGFSWSITSPWDAHPAETFQLTSADNIQFPFPGGSVEPGMVIDTTANFECEVPGSGPKIAKLRVDETIVDIGWTITCTGVEAGIVSVEIHQGPLTANMLYIRQATGSWSEDIDMRTQFSAGRRTFMTIHATDVAAEALDIGLDFPDLDQEIALLIDTSIREDLTQDLETVYTTQTTFDIGSEFFSQTERFDISFKRGGNDVFSTLSSSFARLSGSQLFPLEIHFVPLSINGNEPAEIDGTSFLKNARNFLPLTEFTVVVEPVATVSMTDEDDALDAALRTVNELWVDRAPFPRTFFHGIFQYIPDEFDSCGIAYVPGNAALSAYPIANCPDNTIAHEFGHNLNLSHTPACSAPNPDPTYPYRDGTIGTESGWLIVERQFLPSTGLFYDVMGYCNERIFISQYHFNRAALNIQSRSPFADSDAGAQTPQILAANTTTTRSFIYITGVITDEGEWMFKRMVPTSHMLNAESTQGLPTISIRESGSQDVLSRSSVFVQDVVHGVHPKHWFATVPRYQAEYSELAIDSANREVVYLNDFSQGLREMETNGFYHFKKPD